MPEPPIRILLVDDSEDYFLILQELLLSIADFHVTLNWVATVATVCTILQAEQYDLILMDYTLGRGQPTGVDVIRELVAAGVTTPILVLTAEDDPRIDQAAVTAGAVDYLTKTELTPRMLARAIRYAIARYQVESALRDERAALERRVTERTADLSAANTELTRAARLKDEFLATMSHEMRTPLSAILGLSEALSEHVYGVLTTDQQEVLHQIRVSGEHFLAVINDILDLAKIGAGRMTLDAGLVDLEPLCRGSLQLIQAMATQKRIAITYTLDPTVAALTADGRRLKQVLVNLLSNAIKFTPAGGTVGLEVIGDVPDRQVQFVIWDTGIGIAAEDQARLFQLFVQLDSGLARQYKGCGLGLALVARITELHGGSVAVHSVKGQGSRFTITLPWHTPVPSVHSA